MTGDIFRLGIDTLIANILVATKIGSMTLKWNKLVNKFHSLQMILVHFLMCRSDFYIFRLHNKLVYDILALQTILDLMMLSCIVRT